MNMSLGGSRSNAVNQAVNALRAAGVVPVVAAGNEGVDGKCGRSPLGADHITHCTAIPRANSLAL